MDIEDPVITDTIPDVPVQIVNEETVTSRGYQYSVESGEMIDVKVEGKRSVIDNLQVSDISAVADFSRLSNMNLVDIAVSCVSHGEDEVLVTGKTETMSIKLEDSETQSFNLHIVMNGEVKEGYAAFESSETSLIQVTGAKSQVAKVKEVAVYIDVDGKKDSFTMEATPIAIDIDDNIVDANKISLSQNSIKVGVDILPVKQVNVDVRAKGMVAYGCRVTGIDYAPSTVLVAGTPESLNKVDTIYVSCDVTDMDQSVEQTFNLADVLESRYDNALRALDNDTAITAVVTITKLDQRVFDIDLANIQVVGVAEGLECVPASTGIVRLGVMGMGEELAGLTAEELGLYVDATDKLIGTHTLSIQSGYNGDVIIEGAEANFVIRRVG